VRATWWRDEQDEVMDDRAGAQWRSSQEACREVGPNTRGLVVCPQNHRRTVAWFGPQNQVRSPNTMETRSGRVGKLRSGGHTTRSHGLRRKDAGCDEGVPSDGKTHKHYINAPTWVVSPVVELGVVESFPTPAGPDI
jgi:hypothetical protein